MAARCLTRFLDTVTVIEQIERTSDALLPLHRHRRLQHSEIQSAEESNGGYVNLVSRLLNEQGMCPSVAMQSLPMRALWRQMLVVDTEPRPSRGRGAGLALTLRHRGVGARSLP